MPCIGTDNIEAPANFSHSSDDNMITFTWDHVNPSMVDHYEMVLERTDQTGEQTVFPLERNRFSLPLSNSPYTATLTAISVCGRQSMAVSREGIHVDFACSEVIIGRFRL